MERKLTLLRKDGHKVIACLIVEETIEPSIELRSDIFNSGKIKCEKLYYGFQELHKLLDTLDLRLLCIGYRYDVRPSGMTLSMGHGTKAYIHKLGKPATDMVDIFDATDEEEAVVSYHEQQSYSAKWIESLRQKK